MVVQLQHGSVSKWLVEVHFFFVLFDGFEIVGIAIKVDPESLTPLRLHAYHTLSVIHHYRTTIAFVVYHLQIEKRYQVKLFY